MAKQEFTTHIVWYPEKESKSNIETSSNYRVLNKEHFMENVCRKCAIKTSPRLLLILLNSPKQPIHSRKLLKIRYVERDYQQNL